MSSEKVQSQPINGIINVSARYEQKGDAQLESHPNLNINHSQSYLKQQVKSQNPKIGRPAKTDQQQQFKKCYMQNKQKFQLECQLLVFIHQTYFDQIIDNPINTRVCKQHMDKLFLANDCQDMYRTLLQLNQNYFKNSSYYPEEKLKYTSLIDVAYMCTQVKQKHGEKMSTVQMLLIIFFYLYNQKLMNQKFYDYFVKNLQKFREGMIFGPGGKNAPKMDKLDKLIICLALTLADLQKILIQQEVIYSEQQYSGSESQFQQAADIKRIYLSKRSHSDAQALEGSKPKKRNHTVAD